MKKLLAILLSVIMVLSLVACGNKTQDETPSNDDQQQNTETETKTVKVGLICIGDENDQGYTYNFIRGKEAATEQLAAKGINVDWVVKYNIGENSTCEDANLELAEEGCELIINNSFGFEEYCSRSRPTIPRSSSSAAPTRAPGTMALRTPTTPSPTSTRAATSPASLPV